MRRTDQKHVHFNMESVTPGVMSRMHRPRAVLSSWPWVVAWRPLGVTCKHLALSVPSLLPPQPPVMDVILACLLGTLQVGQNPRRNWEYRDSPFRRANPQLTKGSWRPQLLWLLTKGSVRRTTPGPPRLLVTFMPLGSCSTRVRVWIVQEPAHPTQVLGWSRLLPPVLGVPAVLSEPEQLAAGEAQAVCCSLSASLVGSWTE